MGMDRWLVWLGWFFHSFFIILLVISIMTLMLKLEITRPGDDNTREVLPPVIINTDAMFIWVLLLLYGISSITFCFFISTLFSRRELHRHKQYCTVHTVYVYFNHFFPWNLFENNKYR